MPQTELHPGVHQFTLTDAKGKAHTYLVNEHPAGEGMEILYALLSMGAPTVLGLAGAAVQSERLLVAVVGAMQGGTDAETSSDDWKDLASMAVGLDLPSVGRELGAALATGKAPELTRRVLARTWRDGKRVTEVFDQAYQANYLELLTVVWKVCSINGFFPLPATSVSSPPATTQAPPPPPPLPAS